MYIIHKISIENNKLKIYVLAQSQKISWQLVTKASEDESEEISVGEQWW
jgi:hypothetical protein